MFLLNTLDGEETKKEKDEKDHMSFEEDVYCNLALKLVQCHDASQITLPAVHAFFMWSLNCIFQCLIVCIVLLAAENAETPLEYSYFLKMYNHTRDEASSALNVAVATGNPALPAWFDKSLEETCGVQMVPAFLWTSPWMTLLWIMVMIGEIKTSTWWFMFFWNSPRPRMLSRTGDEEADDEDDEYDDDDEVRELLETRDLLKPNEVVVTALTPCLKAVLLFVVPGMRVLLAVLLMIAGTKFIFVQTDLANAVLKVMTLKFVMTVDDVLIKALATQYGDRTLKLAKIFSPGTRSRCCGIPTLSKQWESFGGVFWLVSAIVLWLGFFWAVFQGEFSFRRSCLSYHQAFPGSFGVHQRYSIIGAIQLLRA